ncbi:MAG: nucleotide pyrophosphatase/phosphodiesterase family protein [Candidatus Bathyarchaeota archaeon]
MKKIAIVVLDGCGSDYVEAIGLPHLEEIGKKGFVSKILAAVPTITNVNATSILTGTSPQQHGITGNSYYEPTKDVITYMNDPQLILVKSLFYKFRERNIETGLFTVKDKLANLLSTDADISVSAENPPKWAIKKIGPAPNVYDPEVSIWLIRCFLEHIKIKKQGFFFIVTTDTIMHFNAPRSNTAKDFLQRIDEIIGQAFNKGDLDLVVTADHGMSKKQRLVNPQDILQQEGISNKFVPIVKDAYTRHHLNLGGSCYLYITEGDIETARDILVDVPGVEKVYSNDEAATHFCLHPSRIGHLLLLGDRETVFSDTFQKKKFNIRSHGSLHERDVPLISSIRPTKKPSYIWDVASLIPRKYNINSIYKCKC